MYCRIVASVRSQEGRRYLMLLQADPVANANHLTEHLLAVIHNELAANKQPTGIHVSCGKMSFIVLYCYSYALYSH
jgi:hypothetical protein